MSEVQAWSAQGIRRLAERGIDTRDLESLNAYPSEADALSDLAFTRDLLHNHGACYVSVQNEALGYRLVARDGQDVTVGLSRYLHGIHVEATECREFVRYVLDGLHH